MIAPTTTVIAPPSTNQPPATPTTQVGLVQTPTTVVAASLPFTGANSFPILIAALVLVMGGAALLLASRLRGGRAR